MNDLFNISSSALLNNCTGILFPHGAFRLVRYFSALLNSNFNIMSPFLSWSTSSSFCKRSFSGSFPLNGSFVYSICLFTLFSVFYTNMPSLFRAFLVLHSLIVSCLSVVHSSSTVSFKLLAAFLVSTFTFTLLYDSFLIFHR